MATALNEWIAVEGGSRRSRRWQRIGAARATLDPGVYIVDVRGMDVNADQFDGLRLAGAEESSVDSGFPVMEAVAEGQLLRVRVAEFAASSDPYLWLLRQPPGFLIEALRDGIAGMGHAGGLANLLAQGRIGGTLSEGPAPAGLLPAQAQAYRACLGTGVWLVWGPPGTGKTRLLQAAICDLIAQGKRVLLVSATNIAVDNALLGVLRQQRPPSGQVVRVGPPQLRQIADDAEVSLPMMVRARLAAVEEKRRDTAMQITRLQGDEKRLRHLRALLAGFDAAADATARSRLRRPELACASLVSAIAECEAAVEAGTLALARSQRRSEVADERMAETAEAQREWRLVEAKLREGAKVKEAATEAAARVLVSEAACARIDDEAAPLRQASGLKAWRNRRALEGVERRLALARADLAELRSHAARAHAIAEDFQRDAEASIRASVARARFDLDEIRRRAEEATEAKGDLGRLRAARARNVQRLETLRQELAASRAAEERITENDRHRWPAHHAEAESVARRVAQNAPHRNVLEKSHADLQKEYEKLAQDAQGEIIRGARLVATTLARFRISKAVAEGPYDVVLIDEAGAANLPEVLLATSKAAKCAVLLGDFLQLGAVLPKAIGDNNRPDIKRWLIPDVYRHCGIITSDDARNHPGCLVMDTQHRFGPRIMELANRVAYGGVLKAGGAVRPRAQDDPEIVLINTDGLHELARVERTGRSSGWWPAGTLLSRALRDVHHDDGETVGVVTPYSAQAEATLEALRDIEQTDGRLAEVGTAHRFQGREFPIVVFDTVEGRDNSGMWMAQASLAPGASPWQQTGGRLFNVAITRVQTRLYVIGSRERILNSRPTTMFGHLAHLVREQKVRTVEATALIAPPTDPDVRLGPFGTRLAETLARHVEITDVHDERSFYEAFTARLSEATSSIWLWSPWVARRVRALLPALREAVARGVRVTVFVRDPSDKLQQKESFVDCLTELQAIVPAVIRVNDMHQKIAVIDEHTVMMGSLNALSQSRTREIMLTVRGGHFARKILEHEHAEDFSRPPRCGGCRRLDVDLRRRADGRWQWRCYNKNCPGRKGNQAWVSDVVFRGRRSGGRP
ncbi:AAA domain-containing protein [Herbidospora sp. RD11066]